MATIWGIVGIITPLVLGIGLSFLGLTPPDFKNARRLAWAEFGVLNVWTVIWLFLTYADVQTKIYTVIGIGVVNVIGLPCAMIFIGYRERIYKSGQAAEQPEALPATSEDNPKTASPTIPAQLRVSITFLPAGDEPKTVAIIIRNTGGSAALRLHVWDVHVSQKTIRFPDEIVSLRPRRGHTSSKTSCR